MTQGIEYQNLLRFQQAGVVGLNGDLRQKALQNNNRNTFGHPYVTHPYPILIAVANAFPRLRDRHGDMADENHIQKSTAATGTAAGGK